MRRLRDIETSVLKTLGKVNTIGDSDCGLSVGMLERAAYVYAIKYGYIPEAWSSVLDSVMYTRMQLVDYCNYDESYVMNLSIGELYKALEEIVND